MVAPRRIPVTIVGDWQPVAYVGQARWEGVAIADEPITVLALSRDSQAVNWSRARRGDDKELKVVLAVFPTDSSSNRLDVSIHLNIASASLALSVKLSSTAPLMFSLDHHVTSEPAWFARPRTADHRIDLGALFLATADTVSARNHLWHLRDGITSPDSFADALAYGRAGQFKRDK